MSDPFGFHAAINWAALDDLDTAEYLGELEEHAFQPGDGERTYTDDCQFPGCGRHLSEHEEGEPCCYASVTSGGASHAPDCDKPV